MSAAQPTGGGFADVLVRLAGERPNMLVLSGEDPGPATWFAEIWPERVLTVPPLPTRVAIAEGITIGGGEAIVVVDPDTPELSVPPDAGILLVSTDAAHLGLAHRFGLDVCQPGWVEDLPALLVGALGSATSTLLFLATPTEGPAATPRPPAPTSFGEHRVLHGGGAGLVLGAGATAPLARDVAAVLERRHVEVTALDMHSITAASGLGAGLLHDHLLVGPVDTPRAAALTQVPVGDGDVSSVADRIVGVLGPR